jgi:ferredoxin
VKARVDPQLCTGHGRCYELAPEVFEEDERGHGVLRLASVPPELERKARLAEGNCPEGAVRLEGG